MLIQAWLIALFFVVLASASIFGFALASAHFFSKKNEPFPEAHLFLGFGVFLSALYLLGLAGLFKPLPYFSVFALGLFSLWYFRKGIPNRISFRLQNKQSLWIIFPVLYLAARFFSSGLPQQHSDPLYYHLLAPKTWVMYGKIALTPEHPSFAQAGLWESLFALPMLGLGIKSVFSLIVSQIYSQWMHMIWGQMLCVFAAFLFLKKFLPKVEPKALVFAAWLCCSFAAFEWTGCLAKSDFLLAAFVLAATLAWRAEKFLLTGLFLGFAFSIRVFTFWAIIPIVLILLYDKKHKALLFLIAGGVLAFAPTLFRNFFYTHNPVFPVLGGQLGFPWISNGWNQHNSLYGGVPEIHFEMLDWVKNKMLERALPKVILMAGVVSYGFLWLFRTPPKFPDARWIFFLTIQLVLCMLCLRSTADGRYGIFIAILLSLTAVVLTVQFLQNKLKTAFSKEHLKNAVYVFLFLGLLVRIPLEELYQVPKKFWFKPASKYVEQFHPLYSMHQWIREKIPAKEKVLFLGEKFHYYLDRDFESVGEMRGWEDLFHSTNSINDLSNQARMHGYRYLQANNWSEANFEQPFRDHFWKKITLLKKKAVYVNQDSLIFDLNSF